jgi:DASH complex subunit ASK1
VSLSGYEELAADGDDEETALSQSQDNNSAYVTSTSQADDETAHVDHETYDQVDNSLLDNGDISGSTPRPVRLTCATDSKPTFADYPSPYEALKRELTGESIESSTDDDPTQLVPTTPGVERRLPDMSMTSTPLFVPTSYLPSTAQKKGENLLLHRVLDKNYRLRTTPHITRKEKKVYGAQPLLRDTISPMSSPPVAVPRLRSEIFSSPVRQQYGRPTAPRTPGVSVQTPAAKSKGDATGGRAVRGEITWESDSDQDAEDVYKKLGMSPPKTIQFVLAPSRLLQTPGRIILLLSVLRQTNDNQTNSSLAREASKQIVEDLLMTAGVGHDTDEEASPSMVKMQDNILDDSF